MTVEPITSTTPRPVRRVALTQRWCDLAFLHWPVDPDRVAPLLPSGTRPDVLDGTTYVGLIPFRMRDTSIGKGPALPYLGTFCETNVRLYSVDDHGRRGVVFRSLDAERLIPVSVGRLAVRLPYIWSRMHLRHHDDVVTYSCRRRGSAGLASRVVIRRGRRIEVPDGLERFLTDRWGLHVTWHGRTMYVPNEHEPWPLHRADLLDIGDELVADAGLLMPGQDPVSVLYSPGVAVRFGPPVSVARPTR